MLGTPLVKVLYDNLGTAGTWTADTEVATLPATNLADPSRQLVHRSTGLGAPNWWKVDLGSAKAVDAVALVSANLSTGLTVTVKGNATDSWGAPTFSTTFTSWTATLTGAQVNYFASTQTFRWWRVEVTDAANPDGYVQLGVLALGPVVSLTVGPQAFRHRVVDPSIVVRAPSGTPYATERTAFSALEFTAPFIPEATAWGTMQTALRNALKTDVVLSIFPAAPSGDDIAKALNLYGRFVDLGALGYIPRGVAASDWDWGGEFWESL